MRACSSVMASPLRWATRSDGIAKRGHSPPGRPDKIRWGEEQLHAAHAGAHADQGLYQSALIHIDGVRFLGAERRDTAADVAGEPQNVFRVNQLDLLVPRRPC